MRLGTLVDRAYNRMCQKNFGISGGEMRELLALRRGGPPYAKRPTDLFRALLITSGAMIKKVDRLATAGYIDRMLDPAHQGGFLVHLTKRRLRAVEREAGARFALRTLSILEQAEASHSSPGEE